MKKRTRRARPPGEDGRSKAPPVALDQLLEIRYVDAGSDVGAFVVAAAARADVFLEKHSWGRSFWRLLFGCGVRGIAASYLVQLVRPVQGDEWLWVVTGSVPGAYLVLDRAPTPADALAVYSELARDWMDAVKTKADLGTVFPFAWPQDDAALDRFAGWLDVVDRLVATAPQERQHDAAWIDAVGCPRLAPAGSQVTPKLGRGSLVVDERGRVGIAIEQAKRPAPSWLALQRDPRVRATPPDAIWWTVASLSGGAIVTPAGMLVAQGKPTAEQVEIALASREHTKQWILDALAE